MLRVIDFGTVSPLRSQTLWHAVAHGVSAGSPPTLSFVRSRHPYVSLGFHHCTDELDMGHCQRSRWPVYRRRVGGGPVYLDERQLCFQLSMPVSAVPPGRPAALRRLLEPALEAFRAAGLDADLDADLEVVVGDRKVCGHGAAQIGSAVVIVGNLIESFDHLAAASVLRTPGPNEAGEALRLMRRYVAWDGDGPPVDAQAFVASAQSAYGRALGLVPRPGALRPEERRTLRELDRRFQDPAWTRGVARPASPVWRLKVRAGVWLYSARRG
ncbi:MAG: lipoate--protein ligase family protein, partial [Acidimicrobiales bacterium]